MVGVSAWGICSDQITSEHAGLAIDVRRQISRQSVKVGGGTGGIPRRKPLGEQAADHACQDITGSGRGHSWIAGRTNGCQAIRSGNHRARPFEDHEDATFARKSHGRTETILIDGLRGRFGFESGHFSWVRRDDRRSLALGQQRGFSCQGIQRIRIQHAGLVDTFDEFLYEVDGLRMSGQAGADHHGITSRGEGKEALQSGAGRRRVYGTDEVQRHGGGRQAIAIDSVRVHYTGTPAMRPPVQQPTVEDPPLC